MCSGVLQYTILLFTILTAEVVTVTFLAVLRDKVTQLMSLEIIVLLFSCAESVILDRS